MTAHYTVRPATEADAPTLARLIELADRSGGTRLSYQGLFELTDTEAQSLLQELAATDLEGQELTYPNFLLIEQQGQIAGGLAAWVEGADGLPSTLIKGQLLAHVLGAQRVLAAKDRIALLSEIELKRTEGALQLDSIAIFPDHQGQGLLRPLVEAAILRFKDNNAELRRAEIHLLIENERARKAYERLGFRKERESKSTKPELTSVVSGTGFLLLARELD
jgi:ribosomal protein S18 acetylase RimI-like enzyme